MIYQTLQSPMQYPKRVLIIRIDGIGDLLCATPCLHSLRKAFPESTIDFLANLGPHQVLEGNQDIDHLLIDYRTKISGSRLKGLLQLPRRLFRALRWRIVGYDLVVVAHYGVHHRAIKLAQTVRCSSIFVNIEPQFEESIQDKRVSFAAYQPGQHEVIGVHSVVGKLVNTPPGRMKLCAPTTMAKAKRIIGINISASAPERQWPLESFKILVDYIASKHSKADLIITGNEADTQRFTKLWGEHQLPAEIIKTPSLWSYISAVNLSDIYISSDGGGVHIASALGKAQVALFQNVNAKLARWHPWQVPNRVVSAYSENAPVELITPDQVNTALDQLIDELDNLLTAAS